MTSTPFMPFYIGDYIRDTMRLSTLEHGAYILLIMDYWSNGDLPNDDKKLARIARMSDLEWLKIRDTIGDLFKAGPWKHRRIEIELEKATGKSSSARESAKVRWKDHVPVKKRPSKRKANGHTNADANAQANEAATAVRPPSDRSTNEDANAVANGMLRARASLSEPESISESKISESAAALRPAKYNLAEIERNLRLASGHENSPAPSFFDLSPILGLLDGGADLELDVLPAIYARPNIRAVSWAYYVPQIQDYRARRLGIAASTASIVPSSTGPPQRMNGKDRWAQAIVKAMENADGRPSDDKTIDGTYSAEPRK